MNNAQTSIPSRPAQTIQNVQQGILSVVLSPLLKGRARLLSIQTANGLSSQQQIVSFQLLYTQMAGSKLCSQSSVITFKFDLQYLNQNPIVELKTCDNSTCHLVEISYDGEEFGKHSMEKMIVSLLASINDYGVDDLMKGLGNWPMKLINLPYNHATNKNQTFSISKNSSFSRLATECFEHTNNETKNVKLLEFDQKDATSSSSKGKRNSKPMKKNANLPKFLIRIFIKYLDRFRKVYPKKEFDKLYSDCKKMKESKKIENKQHALGLRHLRLLFQEEKPGYPDPELNRKVVIQIIEKYLLEQICENSQIPETHRLGYLVACRVYALRCRNSVLAARIQSK